MPDEYKSKIAIAILGLNSPQALYYWMKTNVIPAHKGSTGCRHVWTFRELVALRVLRTLRTSRIPLQQIRKVLSQLNEWGHALTDTYLIVENGDVLLVESGSLVSILRRPGQREMSIIIDLATTSNEVLRIIEEHKKPTRKQRKTA